MHFLFLSSLLLLLLPSVFYRLLRHCRSSNPCVFGEGGGGDASRDSGGWSKSPKLEVIHWQSLDPCTVSLEMWNAHKLEVQRIYKKSIVLKPWSCPCPPPCDLEACARSVAVQSVFLRL